MATRSTFLAPATFLALAAAIAAALTMAPVRAADRPPVVVELFTSQGCSSCPPADAYLGELAKRDGIIALAYHVDYWNYIGWPDPFATRWATQRQREYGRVLNQRYVYTPEIVVAGAAHEIGSERAAVERLIAEAAATAGPPVTVERRPDGGLLVHVGEGTPPETPATVWLARFDREHTTKVIRGENGGRTLHNYQIVRAFDEIGTWTGDKLEIAVEPARLAGSGAGGCAVLVQRDGVGPILGAAILKNAGGR